jgi:hypothetical protein
MPFGKHAAPLVQPQSPPSDPLAPVFAGGARFHVSRRQNRGSGGRQAGPEGARARALDSHTSWEVARGLSRVSGPLVSHVILGAHPRRTRFGVSAVAWLCARFAPNLAHLFNVPGTGDVQSLSAGRSRVSNRRRPGLGVPLLARGPLPGVVERAGGANRCVLDVPSLWGAGENTLGVYSRKL